MENAKTDNQNIKTSIAKTQKIEEEMSASCSQKNSDISGLKRELSTFIENQTLENDNLKESISVSLKYERELSEKCSQENKNLKKELEKSKMDLTTEQAKSKELQLKNFRLVEESKEMQKRIQDLEISMDLFSNWNFTSVWFYTI